MYRGLFLADIHIGALSYEQTYKECDYLRKLLRMYREDSLLDFIILGGDFFDKQLYGNDPYISIALKLMMNILISAKKVRIVYGTSSHDSDQYQIFDTLVSEAPEMLGTKEFDFKIINTVEEEELFPNLKVLYIPEEYIFDQKTYYDPYFSKENEYDYVFGHGMIYEAFEGRVKEPEKGVSNRRKAPSFRTGDLAKICKGIVYFGHYHIHTEMNEDKVKYVGSFSRWKFGEEEDKGFFQLFCNLEERIYKDNFVINEKALKYITIAYSYKDSVFKSVEDMHSCVKEILKRIEKVKIDYLKVLFNIPVGYENPEGLIKFFKEAFEKYPFIKLEFSNGYVEHERTRKKTSLKDIPEEFRIILDKNVPEEDKVQLFLKLRREVEMPLETIRKYLKLEG